MAMSLEERAAKKMAEFICRFDFDPGHFAIIMTNMGVEIQKRMFHMFMRLCVSYAAWYDAGAIGEDHPLFTTCVYAKRIVETVPPDHVRV